MSSRSRKETSSAGEVGTSPAAAAPGTAIDGTAIEASEVDDRLSYLTVLRRVPSQMRGREKVARILDAADRLIVELGYEQMVSTPSLLFERAQVSAGSFYTYFRSPHDVVDALALRFMERARASADRVSQEAFADWVSAANRFFETFVGFYQQPAVYELWLRGRLSEVGRQADADTNAYLAERLNEMLKRATLPAPSADPIRYLVAIEIYDYLMRLAFRAEGQARIDLLGETRHAFLTYLASTEPVKQPVASGTRRRIRRGQAPVQRRKS